MQDLQSTGHDVGDLGRGVEQILEEEPDTVVDDTRLHHLDAVTGVVGGLKDHFTVLVGHIVDAGHEQLKEVVIVVVVHIEEIGHLIFEQDVAIVLVDFGQKALLAQKLQYVVGCSHVFLFRVEG